VDEQPVQQDGNGTRAPEQIGDDTVQDYWKKVILDREEKRGKLSSGGLVYGGIGLPNFLAMAK
jgi:hypothetical protein